MKNKLSMLYFSSNLLEWYRLNKRDLPWRRSRDPYHIWVSEIMLQQTRVETVIPYFYRFIERFPSIDALAEAPEEEVLKAWEGLGYYSRARNLQSAVREVKERYNSVVPSDKADISSLKGVGPYTSGAILSIAYNQPEPAVDGNVMRVLSRYFQIEEDIMKGSTRVGMESLVRDLIPLGSAGDFTQALMELGALVCTPKSAQCTSCPVTEHCSARVEGVVDLLPVKKKAKPPRPEKRMVALIEGVGEKQGRFLIRQRAQEGLLARMWELPHWEWNEVTKGQRNSYSEDERNMDNLQGLLFSEHGLKSQPQGWLMNTEHTFSHIHWDMRVYQYQELADMELELTTSVGGNAGNAGNAGLAGHLGNFGNLGNSGNLQWIRADEMDKYAFPNVFLRIIKQYVESVESAANH